MAFSDTGFAFEVLHRRAKGDPTELSLADEHWLTRFARGISRASGPHITVETAGCYLSRLRQLLQEEARIRDSSRVHRFSQSNNGAATAHAPAA